MSREDFDSLTPTRDFSRRDFVRTGIGSGFAAAVMPVMAQTVVKTDTAGLDAGEVKIAAPGGLQMRAYRAQPAKVKNAPVILVISEIFGVHEHIADVARRFAKLGYCAVAPDLFMRQGDPTTYTDIPKLQADIITKVPDAQVMADLDATVAWAKGEGADTGRLGITGFCWGGRITWLYAAHSTQLKAGVAWYGRLVGNASPLTPSHPVDLAASLKAPVRGLYGGKDGGIPLDTVERMKAALANGSDAAKKSDFIVYPEAPHAFHADYRPSFRKEDAADGWNRCLAWFRKNGVA